jgi:uncharacterized protein (DUF4415 family)
MSKRIDPEQTDHENPEWTDEDFARARPAGEVLSEIFGPVQAAEMMKPKRGRPAIDKPKEQISLRLDPAIIDAFRASGGGWQTRINSALASWLEDHDPKDLKSA